MCAWEYLHYWFWFLCVFVCLFANPYHVFVPTIGGWRLCHFVMNFLAEFLAVFLYLFLIINIKCFFFSCNSFYIFSIFFPCLVLVFVSFESFNFILCIRYVSFSYHVQNGYFILCSIVEVSFYVQSRIVSDIRVVVCFVVCDKKIIFVFCHTVWFIFSIPFPIFLFLILSSVYLLLSILVNVFLK